MPESVFIYKVAMTCDGCSNAVNKVLQKAEGVSNCEIDLAKQTVTVTSSLSSDEVLAIIKKTGKNTEFVGNKD